MMLVFAPEIRGSQPYLRSRDSDIYCIERDCACKELTGTFTDRTWNTCIIPIMRNRHLLKFWVTLNLVIGFSSSKSSRKWQIWPLALRVASSLSTAFLR